MKGLQVTGSTPNIVNEAAHTHATVSHFKGRKPGAFGEHWITKESTGGSFYTGKETLAGLAEVSMRFLIPPCVHCAMCTRLVCPSLKLFTFLLSLHCSDFDYVPPSWYYSSCAAPPPHRHLATPSHSLLTQEKKIIQTLCFDKRISARSSFVPSLSTSLVFFFYFSFSFNIKQVNTERKPNNIQLRALQKG